MRGSCRRSNRLSRSSRSKSQGGKPSRSFSTLLGDDTRHEGEGLEVKDQHRKMLLQIIEKRVMPMCNV